MKRSLALEDPTPTNISINSEPPTLKNGTPASPEIALANRVFPTPEGPTSNTPFGIRAPSFLYFVGYFKKSTISNISLLASSHPATSLKVIFCWPLKNTLAFDLPKDIISLFCPLICLKRIYKMKIGKPNIRMGVTMSSKLTLCSICNSPSIFVLSILLLVSISSKLMLVSFSAYIFVPSFNKTSILSSATVIS